MLKNLPENPIYKLLFGGSGVLLVILAIIPLFKKKQDPPSFEKSEDKFDSGSAVSTNFSEKEKIASFVADLTYASPGDDNITVTKVNLDNK